MEQKRNLPITEDLDFHYLLSLMPPLTGVAEYAWLPELFAIVGYERLLTLCKYAGGEVIKIPTLEELSNSIDALQWFYDVNIKHTKSPVEVPANLLSLYDKIVEVYDASNS